MNNLALVINALSQALVLIVFLSAILSFFMDPYHPVRRGVDNLVQPLLDPIRRIIPPVGGLDFSPLVLILLIQFIARIIIGLLS